MNDTPIEPEVLYSPRAFFFGLWMMSVTMAMQRHFNLHPDDIDPCHWEDWYEEGLSPRETATRVYRDFRRCLREGRPDHE